MSSLLAVVGLALAAPLSADDVVRSALDRHPDAVSARADVLAATGQRRQVGTLLANPNVQGGFSLSGDLVFVQAQQPLSLGGEGWMARKEARYLLDAANASARRANLEVAAAARLAWVDAVATGQEVRYAEEALALASRFRAAVEARAGTGELSRLDVALARAREASAAVVALEARQQHADALARLTAFHREAALLGVEGAPLQAVPTGASRPGPRADVIAAEDRQKASKASLTRNRAAALPPVGVGVQYQSDGGSTDFGPMFTVSLPLWDRNQAAIARSRGDSDLAEATLDAARSRAEAEVRLGDPLAEAAATTWSRLDGADVAASEGLGFVEAAFQRGELDVREAVLLQRELLDGRIATIEAERQVAATRLQVLLAHDDAALLGGDR